MFVDMHKVSNGDSRGILSFFPFHLGFLFLLGMYFIKIKKIISLVFYMKDEIKHIILFLMERAKRTSTHV